MLRNLERSHQKRRTPGSFLLQRMTIAMMMYLRLQMMMISFVNL